MKQRIKTNEIKERGEREEREIKRDKCTYMYVFFYELLCELKKYSILIDSRVPRARGRERERDRGERGERGERNKERKRNVFFTSCYCLLYTSPSPRDKRQSRMPSSA